MKVYDFLLFTAEVRGYDGEERRNNVLQVIETCNLQEVAGQLIDTLSKGYRQRVGFAQALLHDPDYLILDEPTDGLDPNQQPEVRQLIKNMGREKCIVLSTHILEEVDAVCSRAIIIGNGRIVADGTPEELRSQSRLHGALTLEISGPVLGEALSALEKIEGVERVEHLQTDAPPPLENDKPAEEDKAAEAKEEQDSPPPSQKEEPEATTGIHVRLFPKKGKSIAQETARFIQERSWKVDTFTQEKGDLNEVFYNLTKGAESS